jgi:predicted TIM-barrel fold metal-dependent hydrolase
MNEGQVFDAHVHAWQPEWIPTALRRSWAESFAYRRGDRTPEEIFPRVSQNIIDPHAEHLTAAMDAAGVGRALLMGVDYGPAEWARSDTPAEAVMARYDEICRASRGRLLYAAGVHPARPDAVERAQRLLASDACRGIKFYPPAGYHADDEICDPLYEVLRETGKTAVFHTGYGRGRLRWAMAAPLHLAEMQARHIDLTIVVAHAGFPCWWEECVAVAAAGARTYLELSLWQADALADAERFTAMIERAIRLCGVDRIIFASDTMYGEKLKGTEEWAHWVQFFRDLPDRTDGRVTEDDVTRLLRTNAEEAYGL